MHATMRHALPVLAVLTLAGCGKPLPIEHFAGTTPRFDAIAFWTGHHRSWGVLENRDGAPGDTVVTDCVGTLQPDGTLHMAQTLTEGDGTVQHRDWHLKRLADGGFSATANDMVGEAHGTAAGRVFHWSWVLALSPGNSLKNVTMDQWMYLEDGGTMLNHTTIRKFGIVVAQVSEQFQAVN
jgi:hypothetical protein